VDDSTIELNCISFTSIYNYEYLLVFVRPIENVSEDSGRLGRDVLPLSEETTRPATQHHVSKDLILSSTAVRTSSFAVNMFPSVSCKNSLPIFVQ
jgi:hypothetical protein